MALDQEDRREGPVERRHYLECPHYENCPARTPEHRIEHEFAKSAMRVMSRLENAKWTAFNTIVVLVVLFLLGSTGLGLLDKLTSALKL